MSLIENCKKHPNRSQPNGTKIECKRCQTEASLRYYWRNRERQKGNGINWDKELGLKCCTSCREWKKPIEFGKLQRTSDGLKSGCKICENGKARNWANKNREKLRVKCRKWAARNIEKRNAYYINNRDKTLQRRKQQWRANLEINRAIAREKKRREYQVNREKVAARQKAWQSAHKEYYQVLRRRPKNKVSSNMSRAIRQAVKLGKSGRRWEHILGYSLSDLMIHLESLFKEGMSWANYAQWEIDHIKPISLFQFESCDDPGFHECWALTNLQPLWRSENRSKNNKYLGD